LVYLVLSLDYEVFGNGSGDVRRDMVEPTQRLLALCNEYGAKLSIMFEVGEYWAMREAEQRGLLDLGYSPTQQIEEQIRQAARDGHDVQLHLHPWWMGAAFADGGWQLHPEYRQITDLPRGMGTDGDLLSIAGALYQGKRTLEALVKPVCPEYSCLVYRAAEFWGQPSRELIAGMKKVGLVADSSVVRGMRQTDPVPTDYRKAKSAVGYWWTDTDDISQSGPVGEQIIEFPVYSALKPYICNFKWTKLRATLKRRQTEKADTNGHGMVEARQSTESLENVLKKLMSLHPMKYDFCKLSARDMIRGLRAARQADQSMGNGLGTPVVMLGHSKDFWNDRNLETFLKFVRCECEGKVGFATFAEVAKRIIETEAAPLTLTNEGDVRVSSK